jgi:hypothetical protein
MEYKESDVENLIAVGYLTGVVDAFSKSMNITAEDMKTSMMKSDSIRHILVDSIGNTNTIELVKKSKEIASKVLTGDNTADTVEPPTESLLQRAEHAITSLFSSKPVQESTPVVTTPEVPPVVEPAVTTPEVPPVVEPVVTTPEVPPVVEPAVTTPEVPPEVPPAVTPVVPNASAMNPMAPPPVSVGGRKKNKSRKRKTKKSKKTRK